MTTGVALQTAGGGTLVRPDEAGAATTVAGRATVQRARLNVYDPDPNGGGKPGPQSGTIEFQFNPTTVSITKNARWSPARSKTGGLAEFTSSDACTMSLEMFLDATSSRDAGVVEAVEKLFACCVPTEQSKAKAPSPPLVVLQWGTVSSFAAYVTSVNATYSLFSADGMPIRATCRLSLTEMLSEEPRQNPTSGSDAVRRVHRMVAGDTLASVAYAEYGDPTRWRSLAAWNDIDDPMRVVVGTVLLLPTAQELLS